MDAANVDEQKPVGTKGNSVGKTEEKTSKTNDESRGPNVIEKEQKNVKASDQKSETKNQDKTDKSKSSSICRSNENGSSNSKSAADKANETAKTDSLKPNKGDPDAREDRNRNKSGSKGRTTRKKSRTPSRGSVSRSRRQETVVREHSKGRRGRSRTPVRRRTRSPVSRYYREPRRWSPKRRSRSPRYRRSPGRTSAKPSATKVLIAKKNFLDELAVQFAQEGKEFPELEQYRCEINKKFVSYPVRDRFSVQAQEHPFEEAVNIPPMFTNASQMEMPANNAVVLTDPYNAYSYSFPGPIPNDASFLPPAMYTCDTTQPFVDSQESFMPQQQLSQPQQIPSTKQESIPDMGSHSFYSSDKAEKSKVLIRITQAVQILEDLDQSIIRSAKFMYRAPTMYNNANQDRSPMCSLMNPSFSFTNQSGGNTDPFANMPRKLKQITTKLGLDEGIISEQIFKRHRTGKPQNHRLEFQEDKKRQPMAILPKSLPASQTMLLQKKTQSSQSACVECVKRKAQFGKNNDKKSVRTANSAVQTNPLPKETVTEFGSITELTPNQVRAVSELIKYIKLTATSGTLNEMRDSMREDQVYNLNRDLRSAYKYFDEMVEGRNETADILDTTNQGDNLSDEADGDDKMKDCDGNPIDEYEEFHRNFCESEEEDMPGSSKSQSTSNQHQYMPQGSINSRYSQFERDRQIPYGNNVGGVGNGNQFHPNAGRTLANKRGNQRGGQSFNNFSSEVMQPSIYNRRN
ncbi:uncharacterized protein LOC129776127 isoform X2 [Toxorhynchites rutilus septentrionalis]|uniref:uncharacterized protein LOC129776127 isoform X2 n=1 Tax=Toxorhynchites rutilus septentrionalis TaxID=329112 RepID=UPI00247988A4|nr:uncharacterized protein LOC129776127 isoform X2 [Toxorhynchites rutilus septentrionalis]